VHGSGPSNFPDLKFRILQQAAGSKNLSANSQTYAEFDNWLLLKLQSSEGVSGL
jgi:hypothetical protein